MHITTLWANRYGLTDPAVAATSIRGSTPQDLVPLERALHQMAAILKIFAHSAQNGSAKMEQYWSRPEVRYRLDSDRQRALSIADDATTNARHIRAFYDEFTMISQQLDHAYTVADQTIAHRRLLTEPSVLDLDGGLRTEAERIGVVQIVGSATQRAKSRSIAAASKLAIQFSTNPRSLLPDHVQQHWNRAGNNRSLIEDARHRLHLAQDLTSGSDGRQQFALGVLTALKRVEREEGGPVHLLAYDYDNPSGQGSVAIAIGDIAQADSIAVLVPGVANSPSNLDSILDQTSHLHHATNETPRSRTSATIAWLGYDIPASSVHGFGTHELSASDVTTNFFSAANADAATAAGADLANFVTQLRGTMSRGAGLTLVGHSYGATSVSQAALSSQLDDGAVNDIILLAAPGAGYEVESAHSYQAVSAEHVHALGFAEDPVTSPLLDALVFNLVSSKFRAWEKAAIDNGGPFGPDPLTSHFDAQVIDVSTTVPYDDAPLEPGLLNWAAHQLSGTISAGSNGSDRAGEVSDILAQHEISNYLAGESLGAVAAIINGRYSEVPVR